MNNATNEFELKLRYSILQTHALRIIRRRMYELELGVFFLWLFLIILIIGVIFLIYTSYKTGTWTLACLSKEKVNRGDKSLSTHWAKSGETVLNFREE